MRTATIYPTHTEQGASKFETSVTSTVETITTQVAQAALATMDVNRSVNVNHANRLADIIKRGEWRINGESIKFDSRGHLIDGQHRCHAVLRAGLPINSLVIRGLNSSVFDSIDTGRTRSAADVLHIAGKENSAVLAGAARIIVAVENGAPYAVNYMRISHAQILDVVKRRPELQRWARQNDSSRVYPPTMRAAISYIAQQEGYQDYTIEDFWISLAAGSNLDADSPILQLRERMLQFKTRKVILPRPLILAYGVKCIKAYLEHRPMKLLRISNEGDYPQIILEPF